VSAEGRAPHAVIEKTREHLAEVQERSKALAAQLEELDRILDG